MAWFATKLVACSLPSCAKLGSMIIRRETTHDVAAARAVQAAAFGRGGAAAPFDRLE